MTDWISRHNAGAGQATTAAWFWGDVRPAQWVWLLVQLGLVLWVVQVYRIEAGRGLLALTGLLFGGFAVHAVLPMRYRLPFFVALSAAGAFLVLGMDAFWLLGLGLLLLGLCHVPVAFGVRVGLIVGVAVLLAALRGGYVASPWPSLPSLVLPVLASMFMFRLMLYLYEVRHEEQGASRRKAPATLWQRLAYFFMLPNVCFPLFPVVDFQAFRRTYYDAEAVGIYQKGVLWMLRGVVHLLLYRVVYYYVVPSPSEVQTLGGVVQYMVATYLLYLRISGLFHLVVGVLCLFGFNLPETHHLYYLASSFTDYWRRINIYWKDFMMKLFYYPSFMRLRRWGMVPALVLSTGVVFAGTWLLHSYQWYWLRGSFPLTWPDGLFWGVLGVLVALNVVWEARRGRGRRLGRGVWSWSGAMVHAGRVLGMFVLITVLWTLWSSATVGEFVGLLGVAWGSSGRSWMLLVGCLLLVWWLGVLVQWVGARGGGWVSRWYGRYERVVPVVGSVVLLVLGQGWVQSGLGDGGVVLASLQEERLNERDEEQLERGYYEGLLEGGNFASPLWEVVRDQPADWVPIGGTDAVVREEGLLRYALRPSVDMVFHRAPLRTNRWGMRDQEYTLEKPPDTYRIALLGKSYEMGAGMDNHETYEAVTEARLNEELRGRPYARYEILNFAVGGYSLLDLVLITREKVFAFDPDAVFYTAHSVEERILLNRISRLVHEGKTFPDDLAGILEAAGIQPGMKQAEARTRLASVGDDLIRWGYRAIVDACRAQGVIPVWIFVPRTDDVGPVYEAEVERLRRLAEEAGFITLSLEGAYGDIDRRLLQLAPWDRHANAEGHRMLADRLFQEIRKHADQLGLATVDTSRVSPQYVESIDGSF